MGEAARTVSRVYVQVEDWKRLYKPAAGGRRSAACHGRMQGNRTGTGGRYFKDTLAVDGALLGGRTVPSWSLGGWDEASRCKARHVAVPRSRHDAI